MRSMARSSTVINACFPLAIQPIEVPRYRAVNEEVPPLASSNLNFFLLSCPARPFTISQRFQKPAFQLYNT